MSYPVLFLIIFLHSLSSQHTFAANSSSDIPNNIVLYKDVQINPQFNISARIFLPENATGKLPLLIYYHGGAFVTGSPFSQIYHTHISSIVATANIVAVSVDYRLAPQYPLPIAYQDSWLALKWVFSHCNGAHDHDLDLDHDEWLQNYVDFEHVYLGGDSSGANIAHNMAIRVGLGELGQGITLHGMFMNCPYFWGNTPLIGNETTHPQWDAQAKKLWVAAYPNSTRGFDDPLLNPAMDPNLSKLGCRQVLVYVAGKDIFRDRGYYYAESLKENQWDGIVRVLEVKDEIHIFNLLFPNKPKAKEIIDQLALFLNDEFDLIVTI